jgi:hypothetical protein
MDKTKTVLVERFPRWPKSTRRIVLVEIKQTYGVERIYPRNATAEHFTSLTGQKTLSRDTLRIVRELGFEVQLVKQVMEF